MPRLEDVAHGHRMVGVPFDSGMSYSVTNPLLQLPKELSRQRSGPRHVRGALRSE